MAKLFASLLVVGLLVAMGGRTAAAQGASDTVAGHVIYMNGFGPIGGATVRVLAGPLETDRELSRTTAGGDGSYSLSIPVGQSVWIHLDTGPRWWGYSYPVTAGANGVVTSPVDGDLNVANGVDFVAALY